MYKNPLRKNYQKMWICTYNKHNSITPRHEITLHWLTWAGEYLDFFNIISKRQIFVKLFYNIWKYITKIKLFVALWIFNLLITCLGISFVNKWSDDDWISHIAENKSQYFQQIILFPRLKFLIRILSLWLITMKV